MGSSINGVFMDRSYVKLLYVFNVKKERSSGEKKEKTKTAKAERMTDRCFAYSYLIASTGFRSAALMD